jgi:hypothetical protein
VLVISLSIAIREFLPTWRPCFEDKQPVDVVTLTERLTQLNQ